MAERIIIVRAAQTKDPISFTHHANLSIHGSARSIAINIEACKSLFFAIHNHL
jgi:hypothetical protein